MGLKFQVPDASTFVQAIIGDDAGARARAALGNRLAVPQILDVELASALRRAVRHGKLDAADAMDSLVGISRMPGLRRCPHPPLIPRIWALRENISAYDAAYVALAETLHAPLITLDEHLARAAAPYCEVVLLD